MANSEPITTDSVKRITIINALGTVNVNEAFYEIAGLDFAIVNVASIAAHMMPPAMYPPISFGARSATEWRSSPRRGAPTVSHWCTTELSSKLSSNHGLDAVFALRTREPPSKKRGTKGIRTPCICCRNTR
jgi:hypothetical protein